MEEGRILKSGSSYRYEYVLKDHLGNARSGFEGGTGIATVSNFGSDYYPFGLQYNTKIGQPSPKNNYLYNGKELQDKLKSYDYGFRFYDPIIGRWGSVDPLAENHYDHTPFNYVLGNPIKYADFMGLDTIRKNDNRSIPKAGDDIEGDDGSFTTASVGAAVVTAGKGPITYSLLGPDIEPVSGFWGHVDAYMFGRERDGYSYDVNGKSIVRPTMGMPPDLGFGKPTSVLKLVRDIKAWRAAKVVLKPLGLGSTGRTVANNLTEQLAMKEIMSNPTVGKVLKQSLSDSRWKGWTKMSNKTAHGVEIHYNALWENGVIKAVDDFKFITP